MVINASLAHGVSFHIPLALCMRYRPRDACTDPASSASDPGNGL